MVDVTLLNSTIVSININDSAGKRVSNECNFKSVLQKTSDLPKGTFLHLYPFILLTRVRYMKNRRVSNLTIVHSK